MDGVSRRRLLAGTGALGAGLVLPSCSTEKPAPARTVSADDPFAIAEDAGLEVVGYDGGYGRDYVDRTVTLFRGKHSRTTVKLSMVKQVRQSLQPRFDSGRPPDVVCNAGPDRLGTQRLVDDDRLADLTPLLDAPSWDDPARPVRDTLQPGVIGSGSYDGVPRVLNYVGSVYALWYSAALFDRYGWQPPKTWDELVALGGTMRTEKVPLIVYDGVRPQSVYEPILTLAAKQGGADVLKRLDNLEDGAWKQQPLADAAAAFGELAARGLVYPGSKGLDDRQAVDRFARGKAGLIPSGNWLDARLRRTAPATFGLTALTLPPLDGSAELPAALHVAPGEPYVVPEQAASKAAGLEFLRALLAKKSAQEFTRNEGAFTVVEGAAQGLSLGSGPASAYALVKAAGDQLVNWFFASWYPGLGTATADATGALMAGAIEVGEWSERIQRTANDLKKNPDVTKYRRD